MHSQHQAHQQGILEVVDILQHGRCHLPRMVLCDVIIRRVGVEPYIPFIKAQIHNLLTTFFSLYIVTGGNDGADEIIHII